MAKQPSNKTRPKRHPNHYMKYAGMVGQLFVMLLIFTYIGSFIDGKMGTRIFTPILMLLSLCAYFYKLYIDLNQQP